MVMSAKLQSRLTSDQKLLLAECVRNALAGWLVVTCPRSRPVALRIQSQFTTIAGFSFSRFIHAATRAFGPGYHPTCPGTGREFPLSIVEAVALANDVELELASDDELFAAALIAAHSPYGQPQVGSTDWKTYVAAMRAIDVPFLDGDPTWKSKVRDRLRPFRRAVASVSTPLAAE
jgi:hypothetical protein